MSDNKVLATVEGKEITERDLELALQSLGQQAMQFNNPEGKKRLLDEMINRELFCLHGKEVGLDKEEGFLNELESIKMNLLNQYAIRRALENIQVSEEEVKNFYESNKESFKAPASIKASHILIEDEAKAKEIIEEIKSGLAFEDAAKKYSSCPSKENGGDLGFFSRGKMVPEFENAAFELEVDEISSPVQSQFGYHIIKATDKKPESVQEFDEVKGQITQQVMADKQREEYMNKINDFKKSYEVKISE